MLGKKFTWAVLKLWDLCLYICGWHTTKKKALIGPCAFLEKFRVLFFNPVWQHFDVLLILWKLHIKIHSYNKKWKFRHFISETFELQTIEQYHPYFTRLERRLIISDYGQINRVCRPKQIKNHHFVICWIFTSCPPLNVMITNNNTELQSPRARDVDFVCCACQLFIELSRVTQTWTDFVVCYVPAEYCSKLGVQILFVIQVTFMTNIPVILQTFLQVIECSLQDLIQISQYFFYNRQKGCLALFIFYIHVYRNLIHGQSQSLIVFQH